MEKSNTQDNQNSEKRKYDLVFIGGGPATIAFISYLFQKKISDKIFSSVNILIVEKNDNFGSGCLGRYGINTNTSSEGFTRLIHFSQDEVNDKSGKLGLSPNQNPMKSSKDYSNYTNNVKTKGRNTDEEKKKIYKKIPLFEEIYKSSSVQTLLSIGNRPAPLALVGYFLDCLGNFICHYISKTYNKNILLNNSEVQSIKLFNNEEFGILIKKGDINIYIKSKSIVLSTGAKSNENSYFKSIISNKGADKVFNSDFILKQEGYNKIINTLSNSKTKKILIIGGSHSGFSCAWILLNDPANYENLKNGTDYKRKFNNSCSACTNLSIKECVCYGNVIDKFWHIDIQNRQNKLLDKFEITILYRDHIKVYYPSEEEARNDNYTCYNSKEAVNKHGKVYPFVGIRGDAKELYNKIKSNDEKRVKLIKTQTNNEQIPYINDADVIVWACGYVTNTIPIFDSRNSLIDFTTDNVGSIEIDKELQLLNKNKIRIKNLFGIGQGYSTKAPEIINGKKARADSLHLYNTHIASKLYKSLEFFFNRIFIERIKAHSNIKVDNTLKRKSENDQVNIDKRTISKSTFDNNFTSINKNKENYGTFKKELKFDNHKDFNKDSKQDICYVNDSNVIMPKIPSKNVFTDIRKNSNVIRTENEKNFRNKILKELK